MSAVAAVRNEGFDIRVINIRAEPQVARAYSVKRVPTFIYYRNGEEVRRHAGYLSSWRIRSLYRDPLF